MVDVKMTTRFKCVCSYDGTDFSGWQSQLGVATLQDVIEARLSQIFSTSIRIHASGRTDAGVHALAQVFHFDAKWDHPVKNLHLAMKCFLPDGITIVKLAKAKKDFHARFSAKAKRYAYNICEGEVLAHESRYFWNIGNRKLDVKKMQEAALVLLGTHDFTAFSANRGHEDDNPVKTIYKLKVKRRGKKIRIETQGSGYMYKMVRLMVGALFDVGLGKLTKDDIKTILEAKKRVNRFQTAPAKGLFLERVFY